MKKIVFFIIFLFSILFSVAQAPVFQWAKQMGGGTNSAGNSIVVDAAGNVYTTGYFQGTVDFEPGSGTYNLSAPAKDMFVSKLNVSGNFVWAKNMGGGTSIVSGNSIYVDPTGSVYTCGQYTGTADFDPGFATFNLTSVGGNDIFISKLNSSGNFVWAKSIGGVQDDIGTSITMDSGGNIFVTGYFDGTVDFDPGGGIYNLTPTSSGDNMFVLKLALSGGFVWAKNIGGTSSVQSASIALDTLDNVYTTGRFYGTVDFDPGAGTFNLTAGFGDIFISKLDGSGSFIWAKNIGGTGSSTNKGTSIVTDAFGNTCTTGFFDGSVDFDPGAGIFNLNSFVASDIFVLKLDSSGNYLWAKSLSGDWGKGIDVDVYGNIYTTGYFTGTADFDPGVGVYNLTSFGDQDIFISKLDSLGNFSWIEQIGDLSKDWSNAITVDNLGNIYTTGFFMGTVDFNTDSGTLNFTASANDIFVHKIGQTPIGITEISNESSILIYPNPSNNFIDIETTLADYALSVFDIMGKLIFTENVSQNKTRIDISNFSNGIYFLQLASGDKIISKKFIKE